MEDEEKSAAITTKYQSPLPFIIQFRNLIFGKKSPDALTQVTFFINLFIWFVFQLWSILTYFVLNYHSSFARTKGIDVDGIMRKRAIELGYNSENFMDSLITSSGISIVSWSLIFIALVLLWRKKKYFIHFFAIGFLSYMLLSLFYVGYNYFVQDTSTFDKISLLVMFSSIVIHFLIQKRADQDGEINFFGIEEEEH